MSFCAETGSARRKVQKQRMPMPLCSTIALLLPDVLVIGEHVLRIDEEDVGLVLVDHVLRLEDQRLALLLVELGALRLRDLV